MTRITEPHWGRSVGRVDQDGNVIFSDHLANLMRALVKQLRATTATADQAAEDAAAVSETPPVSITGPGVTGSAESGYTITPPDAVVGVPLTITEDAIYTVPADFQVLFHLPISIDGSLVVTGALVEV